MRLAVLTTLALTATAVVVTSWPADAAPRRRSASYQREAYPGAGYAYNRPRTRITVRKGRTFLDPGTEVLPRSRNYIDYALPPLDFPWRIWDTTGNYRSPLPDQNFMAGGFYRGPSGPVF
jgi:hypothetical protein